MRLFSLTISVMFSCLCFSQSVNNPAKKSEQGSNPLHKYTEVYEFQNGLAVAMKNNEENYSSKYGAIDENGNELVPVVYDDLNLVKQGGDTKDNVYKCRLNSKSGLVSSQNDILLPCDYDELVCVKDSIWRICRDGKYGYVTLCGTNKITAKVRCIYNYIENYSADGPMRANYRGKFGVIDCNNNTIIPFEFSMIGDFNANGLAWVEREGKHGIFNKEGNEVQPCVIEEAYRLSTAGDKQTIPFELIPDRKDLDYMFISSNGKSGLLCVADCKTLVPCIYEYLSPVINDRLFCRINGKWGIITKDNRAIQQAVYDKVLVHKKELTQKNIPDGILQSNMYVSQNKRWGMLDKDGKVLIPVIYELLGNYSEGMILAKKEGSQYGYLNDKGEEAVPFIYTYVGNFSDGLAAVKDEKGKYLFVNKTGEVLIKPHSYDSVHKFVDGKCKVYKDGKVWEIDKDGKKIKNSKKDI